jgi:uncharacterized protein (TIGR00255 family)
MSMTGFGRAKGSFSDMEISVEIKSVNSRYLETIIRLPRQFSAFELEIKDVLQKNIGRGKVTVNINLTEGKAAISKLVLDHSLLKQYMEIEEEIRKAAGIEKRASVSDFLMLKELISSETDAEKEATYKNELIGVVGKAVESFNLSRKREGESLMEDINMRLALIEKYMDQVESHTEGVTKALYDKLSERISELLNRDELDKERLEMEIALLADKSDITEEIVRLRSHIKAFSKAAENDKAPGKRLNFLTQEMHREANTIGSKAANIELSHLSVSLKEEIERIREQIQNIE